MGKKGTKGASPRTEAENFVEFERRRYSREWDISSDHFTQGGYYQWMADKLGISDGRVLEIGCGNGASTVELAKRHRAVVAIEENPACIRRAKQVLEASGFAVDVIMRSTFKAVGIQSHEITYRAIKETGTKTPVIIVEGNLIGDPNLVTYLLGGPPFDAMVCWLIGTHSGMIFNRKADLSGIWSPAGYRLRVQNMAYELADRILKPSGLLQIVDRGQSLSSPELSAECLRSHRDQASVTSLMPTDVEEILYEEPTADGATEVIMSLPPQGILESIKAISLVSVLSIKPGG